jgi:hypothetical protein
MFLGEFINADMFDYIAVFGISGRNMKKFKKIWPKCLLILINH